MGRSVLRLGLAALLLSLLWIPSATAATPIGDGHYILDTPQSDPRLFPGKWPLESEFGMGWSMHIRSNALSFTKYAFVDVEVPCSPYESQMWDFDLDGQTAGQDPVRVWPDGRFASLRRGLSLGDSFLAGHGPPKTTDDPLGWLDINGRFVSRKRIQGTLRAWSSDGCDTSWMPYRAVYLRRGWQGISTEGKGRRRKLASSVFRRRADEC